MEHYLINHCAPTLASLKTANLFNYSFASETELYDQLFRLNEMLEAKGVSLTLLRKTANSALIYVYRKKNLERDLANKTSACILKKFGYTDLSAESAIAHLADRIGRTGEFPHEIGLFLGYPPGDVMGYIQNSGKNCKCSGCWKVYCDECEARKTFRKFDKCKQMYRLMFQKGKTVCQLTIAA